MYPVIQEYSHEILNNLLVGMQKVLDRNPDPSFSIHKLIGRAVTDLIVLSRNTSDSALVCEVMVDDFGVKYLYMWGAYSNSKMDMQEVWDSLDWAAQQTQCSYVETISQRPGWGRIMAEYSTNVVPNTIYRKYI